ncbi:hypothetical protein FF125_21255 [Aureibaculum algae]|uniref:TonB-dependent receptor plug domain-containing protein n=1 Tax=Aureibaculum algae TaxID=2584122 RepID=A0A5B7U1E9_9FLAO|nr:hypothetical protein [Aureibaculum algae]QCX40847.1 hypothetical protein FF125_21255 [Aureibaculum algae]
MKKSFLLLLVVLNLSFTVFSQIKSSKELVKKYNAYFELERETIYTHLNKTSYFIGEEIWFKSYIYNGRYQTPYVSSTNIYVSIFNESGNLMESKLLYATMGFTHGNFLVDHKFTPGIYYIKTTTNWMKNFTEDLSHVQMFEIVGNEQEVTKKLSDENKYDLQLLPEGGHIVENVSNTIGFKLINEQGNGVIIKKGTVLDEKENEITTFKSNQFGLGRFTLHAKKDTKYSIHVVLANEKQITKPIEPAKGKGISLKVNATNGDNVLIALETNSLTLPDLIGKQYDLLIHRDGQLIKVKVDFTADKLKYLISLKKSELLSGINILTLVNENNEPIAERLVFNTLKTPIKEIEAAKIVSKGDSSVITLKSNTTSEIKGNFSISVLPASNEAYQYQSTIIAIFLLAPYLKGHIENPYYYFSDINSKKLYDLDLLLLNQGWSKYSWDNIFNDPPSVNYKFETGFQLNGSLNSYKHKAGNTIILSSSENQIHESAIIKNSAFSFDNLFLADSTSINFSLKNKNGKLIKPVVYFNIYPNGIKDDFQNLSSNTKNIFNNDHHTEEKVYSFISSGRTLLDTVELKASPKIKEARKKPLITMYSAKYIDLMKSDFQQRHITSVIRENGFDVATSADNVWIISKRNIPGRTNIPTIFIDNIPLYGNFKQLLNLKISALSDIYISRTPNPGESPAGSIKIFTRNDQGIFSVINKYQTIDNLFGFSMPKKYYTPNYRNTNSEEFLKLGAIHWIPNLTPNETGELIFKIPNYSSETINLYIEGMSYDGSLWSKRETINLAK